MNKLVGKQIGIKINKLEGVTFHDFFNLSLNNNILLTSLSSQLLRNCGYSLKCTDK